MSAPKGNKNAHMKKYITKDLQIDTDASELIYSNNHEGNERAELYRNGSLYYIETNGDPVLLRDSPICLAEACFDLRLTASELLGLLDHSDVSLEDLEEQLDSLPRIR